MPRSTNLPPLLLSSLLLVSLATACDTGRSEILGPSEFTPGFGTSGTFVFDGGAGFVDSGIDADALGFGDVPVWEGGIVVTSPPDGSGDAGAFEMVSRSPEPDAGDVVTDARIELTFSRMLNPNLTPSVRLTRAKTGEVVSTEVTVQGARLFARPAALLEPGERYLVSVGSVSDTLFQSLLPAAWDSEWSFRVMLRSGTVALTAPLDAIAHDAEGQRLWGLSRDERELALVDLETNEETARVELLYVPSDLCVSPDGSRVFVAYRGTSLIAEVNTTSLVVEREIPWPGRDDGAPGAQLHVRCGQDVLWLVDAGDEPGLWSVDLSGASPVVTDHATRVSGVGDLALSGDGNRLYLWTQHGWAEQQRIEVRALDAASLDVLDGVDIGPSRERTVPLDAALFVEPNGNRVITRNRILTGDDLPIILFTFGPDEVLRAADFARDRVASRAHVYSIAEYRVEAPTLVPDATHLFFDSEGTLRLVSADPPSIVPQPFEEPDTTE